MDHKIKIILLFAPFSFLFLSYCSQEGSKAPPEDSIDEDNVDDGLIKLSNITQLNAIRYDLDGNGEADNAAHAAVYAASGLSKEGCPDANAPLTVGGVSIKSCIGYKLVADIDFDRNGNGADADDYRHFEWYKSETDDAGWLPISRIAFEGIDSKNVLFRALLEGNNHKIRNLYINQQDKDVIGLIAFADSAAQIRNLTLEDSHITGQHYVSGLVGVNYGRISNSHSRGGRLTGSVYVGGLVALNYGSISNSSAMGVVSGQSIIGGLIGESEGPINKSYSGGEVIAEPETEGGQIGVVGGLVGQSDALIFQSYSSAVVRASGAGIEGRLGIGGLLGYNFSLISNSYAVGAVSFDGTDGNVGGLIGIDATTTTENSYAAGMVEAKERSSNFRRSNYTGGLFGKTEGSFMGRSGLFILDGCYWDRQRSDQSSAIGGITNSQLAEGSITGLNSEEMGALDAAQSGWDNAIWDFGDSGQYPVLKEMPIDLEAQRSAIATPNR